MKRAMLFAISLMTLISLGLMVMGLGFRINTSDSIPRGVYRITHASLSKNAYVLFCPDNRMAFRQALKRGYIDPGLFCEGYGYLMKKVVALSGDIVSVTSDGVFVNNTRIPYSKPKLHDGLGRLMPQWRVLNYRLKKDEVMTMTNQSIWSFDSRYYGLVHSKQLKEIITPLWVL